MYERECEREGENQIRFQHYYGELDDQLTTKTIRKGFKYER
jgi:hypothetical protein